MEGRTFLNRLYGRRKKVEEAIGIDEAIALLQKVDVRDLFYVAANSSIIEKGIGVTLNGKELRSYEKITSTSLYGTKMEAIAHLIENRSVCQNIPYTGIHQAFRDNRGKEKHYIDLSAESSRISIKTGIEYVIDASEPVKLRPSYES